MQAVCISAKLSLIPSVCGTLESKATRAGVHIITDVHWWLCCHEVQDFTIAKSRDCLGLGLGKGQCLFSRVGTDRSWRD